MNLRRIPAIAILALALVAGAPAAGALPAAEWEYVDRPSAPAGVETPDGERLDVSVQRDGYIYVTAPQPVTVKVFTILGQLVSQAKIPAGTSRIKLGARGIYILKAGSQTRRVTI